MCAVRLCNILLAELTFDNKQLVGKRPYVHHQHELQQNWCIFIHMKQLRFTHFMTSNREAELSVVKSYLQAVYGK
jgi:hypothetical protein